MKWLQDYKCMWGTVSEKASMKAKHEILWKGKCESEWSMRSYEKVNVRASEAWDLAKT